MGLGISIKEDEKSIKDASKDITKWSREVLEAKYKKRQKFFKIFTIMFFVLVGLTIWQQVQMFEAQNDLSSAESALYACQVDVMKNCTITESPKSDLVEGVKGFFTWAVQLDQPYFYKLMIFLGILYLIQIVFACVTDIVEVFLLIFVLVKRIFMWIFRLFKPKKEVNKNV